MIDQFVTIGRYMAVGAICLAIGAYSASDRDRLSPIKSGLVRLAWAPVESHAQTVPIEARVRGHLTTSEVAKVLNCSTRHVVRMIHEGAIPGKQESEGKSWKIPLSVLANVESPSNL